MPRVAVLRLGHRYVRDLRVTTHVALVARAFGADTIYLVGCEPEVKAKIDGVTERWGGTFRAELIDSWRDLVCEWRARGGLLVHLTMYGLPLDDVISQIREPGRDVLVVVGAEKVPPELFTLADFNVAVGHQPHSEVAALALFLDRYYRGEELKRAFPGYRIRVIPSSRGKRVELVRES